MIIMIIIMIVIVIVSVIMIIIVNVIVMININLRPTILDNCSHVRALFNSKTVHNILWGGYKFQYNMCF